LVRKPLTPKGTLQKEIRANPPWGSTRLLHRIGGRQGKREKMKKKGRRISTP